MDSFIPEEGNGKYIPEPSTMKRALVIRLKSLFLKGRKLICLLKGGGASWNGESCDIFFIFRRIKTGSWICRQNLCHCVSTWFSRTILGGSSNGVSPSMLILMAKSNIIISMTPWLELFSAGVNFSNFPKIWILYFKVITKNHSTTMYHFVCEVNKSPLWSTERGQKNHLKP